MAIFGFKNRKDEKLQQGAISAKSPAKTVSKRAKTPAASKKAAVSSKKSDKSSTAIAMPALNAEASSGFASVILRPRITEKSGILSQIGVYTFEVSRDANKNSISRAVKAIYKVTPIRVNVINTAAKNVFVKGRRGTVSGIRKAVVTLKKGEKIDFV